MEEDEGEEKKLYSHSFHFSIWDKHGRFFFFSVLNFIFFFTEAVICLKTVLPQAAQLGDNIFLLFNIIIRVSRPRGTSLRTRNKE